MNSQNFRRTWDLKEIKRKKLDREHEQAKKIKKKLRIAGSIEEIGEKRENKNYKFGTSSVTSTRKQFYCKICDVQTNDSLSFTSHLSSKIHCKNLGVKVKIERSNLQQVQDRFKKFKQDKSHQQSPAIESTSLKKELIKKEDETVDPESLEMAKMMGFASFGKN